MKAETHLPPGSAGLLMMSSLAQARFCLFGLGEAKLCFRLSVLVMLVDRIHLQTSNILVRKQLPPEHLSRRVMLVDHGIYLQTSIILVAAFRKKFSPVPPLRRFLMPFTPTRARYVDYLRDKRGINAEYTRKSKRCWLICKNFVVDRLACYNEMMTGSGTARRGGGHDAPEEESRRVSRQIWSLQKFCRRLTRARMSNGSSDSTPSRALG